MARKKALRKQEQREAQQRRIDQMYSRAMKEKKPQRPMTLYFARPKDGASGLVLSSNLYFWITIPTMSYRMKYPHGRRHQVTIREDMGLRGDRPTSRPMGTLGMNWYGVTL